MGLIRYFDFINRLENKNLTLSTRFEININILTSYMEFYNGADTIFYVH